MSGDSWQQIEDRIRKDYKDIMIANWRLWPFVGLVNFYLVPLNYRLIIHCIKLLSLKVNPFTEFL